MSDIGSEVRREVNAGIATVSRMMERMETRDDERPNNDTVIDSSESSQAHDPVTQNGAGSVVGSGENHAGDNRTQAPCAAHSGSD